MVSGSQLQVAKLVQMCPAAPSGDLSQNPGQNLGQNPGQNPSQNPGQNLGQNPGQNPGQHPTQGTQLNHIYICSDQFEFHICKQYFLNPTIDAQWDSKR